jgi:hypothetical protein
LPEPPENNIAEAADQAARRYEDYKARVEGSKPSSDKRLRVLKRNADRAKLALHKNHTDDPTDA